MPSTGELSHGDYTVGWICALPLEMTAAKAMLDETHPKLPQSSHDHNSYALGKIAGHNVAVASLPSGVYGTTSAAVVAAHMLSTFPCIRFGLMVGIGGGVPSSQNDIRLGDVVASNPIGNLPGVVQYDYGKTMASSALEHAFRVQAFEIFLTPATPRRQMLRAPSWRVDTSRFGSECSHVLPFGSCTGLQQDEPTSLISLHLLARFHWNGLRGKT